MMGEYRHQFILNIAEASVTSLSERSSNEPETVGTSADLDHIISSGTDQ